jgi:Na+/glutamate symporter
LRQPPPPALGVPELIIGGILVLLGVRSLVKWMGTEFETRLIRDQVLFSMNSAARVGLWFAFAGFFLGFALVDEPGSFARWYLFVPIGLAGVQLMTGVFLARSPPLPRRDDGEADQVDR